jgi:predicted PurR-regulated permease PerM/methanogenic corrinoid protein MtbC1
MVLVSPAAAQLKTIVGGSREPTAEAKAENTDRLAFVWSVFPILVIVCATTILYRGRDVLLPLTMALILAVVFSPLASLLGPLMGRVFSAALVVLLAITVIGAVVYFLTIELTTVADKVAGYSANIGNKLAKLETTSPPWIRHLKDALSDIQRRVEKDDSAPRLPKVIQAPPAPPSLLENLRPVVPVLDSVVEFLLIIVLLFFLLYSRKDLRDRFVRMVAMARLSIAPQALETAAQTIGHYLLLFSLTNLGFGLACGVTAWSLGLPSAPLWGLLAFLLRFVPYVGAITAALLPALVAFALFPGWGKSLEVIGAFLLLDQIAGQFVEPFVIGPGIDVSPVALLVSAMYWSWLWGLPGLLLATPLTACLKVAGDYIPSLGFLSLLLGGARELDDYHDFYRMLLELDAIGARELAIRYCDEHGIDRAFDAILVPVIVLAGEEHAENNISQENQLFVVDTIRELIKDLGNRFVRPRIRNRIRILGVCAPGEVHNIGLQIVLELLRQEGAAAKMVEDTKSPQEVREFVKSFSPQVVCLSCTVTECLPSALELTAMLKLDTPNLTIIGGGKAALWDAPKMIEAGCSEVCGTRDEARRALRRLGWNGAKSFTFNRRAALQA